MVVHRGGSCLCRGCGRFFLLCGVGWSFISGRLLLFSIINICLEGSALNFIEVGAVVESVVGHPIEKDKLENFKLWLTRVLEKEKETK